MSTEPTVSAYLETRLATGQRSAYVVCPYCDDVHKHGAGTSDAAPDLGSRIAHCLVGSGGTYTLVPGLTCKPNRLPYRERLRQLMADDRKRGISYIH